MKSKQLLNRAVCALLILPMLLSVKASQAQEAENPLAEAPPAALTPEMEARLAPYFSFLDMQMRPPKGYALLYAYDDETTLYTWTSPPRPGRTAGTQTVATFAMEITDTDSFRSQDKPAQQHAEEMIAGRQLQADGNDRDFIKYHTLAGLKAARVVWKQGQDGLYTFYYFLRRGKYLITIKSQGTSAEVYEMHDAAALSLRKGPGEWSILTGNESDYRYSYNFDLAPPITPGPPSQLGPPVKFNRYQINPPFNYELYANETQERSTYEWRGPLRAGERYWYRTGLNTRATLNIEVIETPPGHALHKHTAEQYFYEVMSFPEIANWRYAVSNPAAGTFGKFPSVYSHTTTVPKGQPKDSNNYIWRGLLYVIRDGERLISMRCTDGFQSAEQWQPAIAAAMASLSASSATPVKLPQRTPVAVPVPVMAAREGQLGEAVEFDNFLINPPQGYTMTHNQNLGDSYTFTGPNVAGGKAPSFSIAVDEVDGEPEERNKPDVKLQHFSNGEDGQKMPYQPSKMMKTKLGEHPVAIISYTGRKKLDQREVRGFYSIIRTNNRELFIYSEDEEPAAAATQPLHMGSILTLRPAAE